MSNDKKDYYSKLNESYLTQGQLDYALAVFGDHLAKTNGYKVHTGIDALQFYLIQKYSWTLSYVRSLKLEDISFILSEDMQGWSLPKEAIFTKK